jgi:hypothetical protein
VLVARTYNPSYSGGRNQEDHDLKPAQANSFWDPISKKPITKKGWWSGSRCRPWVQTSVPPKKKKKSWEPRSVNTGQKSRSDMVLNKTKVLHHLGWWPLLTQTRCSASPSAETPPWPSPAFHTCPLRAASNLAGDGTQASCMPGQGSTCCLLLLLRVTLCFLTVFRIEYLQDRKQPSLASYCS